VVGARHANEGDVGVVAQGRHAAVRNAPGGIVYLQPVAVRGGRIAVIEVFVPQSTLHRGVHSAWLALGAVALALVAGSVLVADRIGARIVAATRHLAAASRSLGRDDLAVRLAADLSHRLRTPLTALRLELETCGEKPDVHRLRRAVGMLSDEVDGIIRTALEPLSTRTAERCDLTEVLDHRLAFWSVLAEDHGRAWTVIGDSTPLWAPVPRDEAEAAVDALIGNIFHHTPEGTAFRAGVVDSTLVVEDDGPGIDDPDRALQRGASSGGSTGLGLDIVRRLAAASGGRVVVTRGHGGGARIEVHLKSTSDFP
jgi:signal transduction histidine kinase